MNIYLMFHIKFVQNNEQLLIKIFSFSLFYFDLRKQIIEISNIRYDIKTKKNIV